MFPRQSQIVLLSFVLFLFIESAAAFQYQCGARRSSLLKKETSTSLAKGGRNIYSTQCASTRTGQGERIDEISFLMKPFSTSSGEIINPYRILKVSRDAERKEIRDAYRQLSKQYHPDMVRHSEVLPGKCNNHDDVEAEWERIQMSYNILSEKKTRMQYDRHEVIADPAAAVQRAVFGAAVAGMVGIGKSIFHKGSSTLDHIIGEGEGREK